MWFKYVSYLIFSSLTFKHYFQTAETCQFIKLYNKYRIPDQIIQIKKKTSKDELIHVYRLLRMLRLKCLQKTKLVVQIFYLHTIRGSWHLLWDAILLLSFTRAVFCTVAQYIFWSFLGLHMGLHTYTQSYKQSHLCKDGNSLVNGFLRFRIVCVKFIYFSSSKHTVTFWCDICRVCHACTLRIISPPH